MNDISRADWELFDALSDEEIETVEIPPLNDDFFEHATLRLPTAHSTVRYTEILNYPSSFGTNHPIYGALANKVG